MIWAVILAAGESRRMGKPKLLLSYRKSTIIETVVESVIASKVNQTLVVLGAGAADIKKKIRRFPVKTTFNSLYRQGMLSSVLRAMDVLPAACEAAVIVLADQPTVRSSTIDSLVESFHRVNKGIIVPVYRQKRGHPFLISLKYRKEIRLLHPQIGLRELLQRHPQEIHEIKVSTAEVLRDIDTAADYKRATEEKQS